MTKAKLKKMVRESFSENPAAPAIILGEIAELCRDTARDLYAKNKVRWGDRWERFGSFMEDASNKYLDDALLDERK